MLLRTTAGVGMTAVLLLGAGAQSPPGTEPDPEVLRLLRRTIAEQTRNPDRIIRNLEKELEATNSPARPADNRTRKDKPARHVEQPAPPPPPPGATNTSPALRQQKVTEVESRLDEMMRAREARERAAATNAPALPAQPLTKRARLDALLRQVVEGKLTDEQYKKERERILAEPE